MKMEKKPRIGIDARIFSQPMNGVARYAVNLLKGLQRHDKYEIYLFTDTPILDEYKPCISGHRVILFSNKIFKKYWKNWVLPVQLLKHKIQLYHALWDKGVPLISAVPSIMTIHDLYAISRDNSTIKRKKKIARYVNYFLEALVSKRIFTVSEYSKKEIVAKLHVRPGKVLVAYPDCDREYIEKAAALKAAGMEEPYFISIAGRLDDVRKNMLFLIRSFCKFTANGDSKRARYKLVVVGHCDKEGEAFKRLTKLIDSCGLNDRVILTGYLDDTALYSMIKRARAMIFTSLFEGFGIPILEAFSLGTPVITSNTSALLEVAASNSALLVNPLSEDELSAAMTALSEDDSLRNKLAANGRRRLADFDWKLTMGRITAVYDEILPPTPCIISKI